ncbi:MAG: cytochrome c1, partial [Hylemonella sp.]|nr:cytochrome c1 [Hylemonella sp.]
MKKLILGLTMALCVLGGAQAASGGGIAWDKAPINTSDLNSLQNGAKLFVNYCLNCHSAAYMRYNRMQEIGFTNEQIKDNLLFGADRKVGETMTATIDPKQAKAWFGANPPDLTVIARSRAVPGKGSGADYLYTYLRTYYPDSSKATGWNNLAFPSVGMPHVLWELQGQR